MSVRLPGRVVEARFVERPNRFVVEARVGGKRVRAHCPNPGRLGEFLHEGCPFLLRRRPDASKDQATTHSVVAALDPRWHVGSARALGEAPEGEASFDEGSWVVLDTGVANKVVRDALARGGLEDVFGPMRGFRGEVSVGESRLDFEVDAGGGERVLVEVKSVTLIGNDGETALFPDAPTRRGLRHVHALTEHAQSGGEAVLFFTVLREDALRVAPNTFTHPAFATALEKANQAGVRIIARSIQAAWGTATFHLGDPLGVRYDPGPSATGVSSKGEPLDANTRSG